jgi:hypothetical protein
MRAVLGPEYLAGALLTFGLILGFGGAPAWAGAVLAATIMAGVVLQAIADWRAR